MAAGRATSHRTLASANGRRPHDSFYAAQHTAAGQPEADAARDAAAGEPSAVPIGARDARSDTVVQQPPRADAVSDGTLVRKRLPDRGRDPHRMTTISTA